MLDIELAQKIYGSRPLPFYLYYTNWLCTDATTRCSGFVLADNFWIIGDKFCYLIDLIMPYYPLAA